MIFRSNKLTNVYVRLRCVYIIIYYVIEQFFFVPVVNVRRTEKPKYYYLCNNTGGVKQIKSFLTVTVSAVFSENGSRGLKTSSVRMTRPTAEARRPDECSYFCCICCAQTRCGVIRKKKKIQRSR